MEEVRTDLRRADAFVKVCGVLAEKKLEIQTDAEGKNSIKGNVVIKIDDTNFITLNVWANELTQKGERSKSYDNMLTVMNEHQSIAEVGEEAATRIECRRGNLEPNTYIGTEDLMEHVVKRYRTSFLTKVNDMSAYNPTAEFEVEGYIDAIFDEVNREGEQTGRLRFRIFVPTYRGVEPLEFFVPAEIADDFRDSFERGQTTKFYGDIVNRTIVDKKELKLAVGGTRTETTTNKIFELVANGATDAYDEGLAYSAAAIQQGLVERDLRLRREKEEKSAGKRGNISTGMTGAATSAQSRPLPQFTGSGFNM